MVCGQDISPVLLGDARKNASVIGTAIDFAGGDVEALPCPGASFDIVVSPFGRRFAPRPGVAVAAMVGGRKSGARMAWWTWPSSALDPRASPPPWR
jgi:ubiquinone/menaquinone biosynthesis C-methylase UbiE